MNHPGLLEWLAGGRRGLSSDQIVTTLTGIDAIGEDWSFVPRHPYDPADLDRCRALLEAVPTLRPLFPKMADVSPSWAVLVSEWDALCAMMDSEAPDWRTNMNSRAPLTYHRMRQLLDGVRDAADGREG